MKQHVTTFEKSTPRLLGFAALALGLAGLTLAAGYDYLPFDEAVALAGSWLALIGFLAAALFLFLWGAAPVPSGTKEVEVEDRVQVKLSNELETALQQKLDKAVNEMVTAQKHKLNELGSKVDEAINSLGSEIDGFKLQLSKVNVEEKMNKMVDDLGKKQTQATQKVEQASSGLAEQMNKTKKQLAESDLQALQKEFGSFVKALDTEGTKKTIHKLLENVKNTEATVQQLNTDSAKLEKTVQSSEQNVSKQSQQVLGTLKNMQTELDKTIKQFQEFNQN